ncbi:MAG: hypothetical protein ACYDC6_15885 [Acidobacteriaceae bacterium]
MSESQSPFSDLRHDLLDSIDDGPEAAPTFASNLNVHGMYETMRFVLRLSPRNHELMEMIPMNGISLGDVTPDAIQAFSTYLHETVHWWQHVGSTSGLLFSLSYLTQCHSSLGELREILATIGKKKPLKAYTDQVFRSEGDSAQAKLASANIAVNNALDVEYYKYYAYSPRTNIEWMSKEPHFESVGHGYFVVYNHLLGMLAETIDPENVVLPDADWIVDILRLRQEQIEGYYWKSPVRLPAVGLRAIYEGQARFTQLNFLDGARNQPLSCTQWRNEGYLSDIYVEAFESFLTLSESEWPETLGDPLVALFLLICDLAMNPTRGLPIKIEVFENFIRDVDVGVRFTLLCQAAAKLPHLKSEITAYSRDEYTSVSEELTALVGYDNPITGLNAVRQWFERAPGLPKLMQEYEVFDYELRNFPIRVFLSHFVAFYQDKLEHPEFFCWAGMYMSGQRSMDNWQALWLRHLSLFSDRGDRQGVFPRDQPGRSEQAIMTTFNQFFGTMPLYDLTRQWILEDGPFVCDFEWMSGKHDQSHDEARANAVFKQVYGVTLDEFEIVQQRIRNQDG